MCVCVHACMSVYACMCGARVSVHAYTCVCVCVQGHACARACVHICVCVCVCARACVPVSQWGDDQSVGVPQVFVAELELGIADVHAALSGLLVPAVAQLRQPCERLSRCHLGNPGGKLRCDSSDRTVQDEDEMKIMKN